MTFLVKKTITRRNPKDMTILIQLTSNSVLQNVQENSSREDWFLQKQRLIMEKGVNNAGAILSKIDSIVHYMYQF